LAEGLRPDPLGELKRSARPPSRNKGVYFYGKGRLRKGKRGRGGEVRGRRKDGKRGGRERGKALLLQLYLK